MADDEKSKAETPLQYMIRVYGPEHKTLTQKWSKWTKSGPYAWPADGTWDPKCMISAEATFSMKEEANSRKGRLQRKNLLPHRQAMAKWKAEVVKRHTKTSQDPLQPTAPPVVPPPYIAMYPSLDTQEEENKRPAIQKIKREDPPVHQLPMVIPGTVLQFEGNVQGQLQVNPDQPATSTDFKSWRKRPVT